MHIFVGVEWPTQFSFMGPHHILFKTFVMEIANSIQMGVKPKWMSDVKKWFLALKGLPKVPNVVKVGGKKI